MKPDGNKHDFHGSILANKRANVKAALNAIKHALHNGMPLEEALHLYSIRDETGKIVDLSPYLQEISSTNPFEHLVVAFKKAPTLNKKSAPAKTANPFDLSDTEYHNAIHGKKKITTTPEHFENLKDDEWDNDDPESQGVLSAYHWNKHMRVPPHHFC